MKAKTFLTVSLLLVFAVTLAWNTSTVSADTACDPEYVTHASGVFTVDPTGVDDTANLQCAFDEAVAFGEGAKVQLQAGDYQTGQIVVNGFHGQFAGVGKNKTTITNLPNLYVTPVDFYLDLPSADNPWAVLFAFVDGNFTISNLGIHIVGEDPTAGWTVWGIDPPITELSSAVVIIGTEAHAEISHVLVEGEVKDGWLFGYNLINGIFFEGFLGEYPWLPISGSFNVHHSTFLTQDSALPVYNLSNAFVVISHNEFDGNFSATLTSDLVNSSFEFSHNRVIGTIGVDFYNSDIPEDIGSTFLVKNNTFQGAYGILFEQTFGDGNECLLLGNNVQNVTDMGIYLGPGINGCTVVGGSNKTNVFDLGTDNVLTGVNNMGTGVGPTIQHFMKP